MKKIYKELTQEQKNRGIIFSSCLSEFREERDEERRHEISQKEYNENPSEAEAKKKRLLDDSFFNKSYFKFNIVRN